MTSQDPITEARVIQDEIDLLNQEKSSLDVAWQRESQGEGLAGLLRLRDDSRILKKLQEVNRLLAFWYGQRNALLKAHPGLHREFGKPVDVESHKRFSATNRLETQAARTAVDRHKRKQAIHAEFRPWCAAQTPQIKASLENWERRGIRERFEADRQAGRLPKAATQPTPRPKPAAIPTRGPIPKDFAEFLAEMEDPMATRSYNRQEDYWQSRQDVRDLYALWREERDKTETP